METRSGKEVSGVLKRMGKSCLCLLLVLGLMLVSGAAPRPEEAESGKEYLVRCCGEAPPQPLRLVGEEELSALLEAGLVAWYEENAEIFLPDPEPEPPVSRRAVLQGSRSPWYADEMWHLYMVGADTVYERGALGQGIRVGVIDSGISPHQALAGRLEPGWNFVENNSDTSDSVGHGTRVAGLIAGERGDGMVGVAPKVTLVPLKCFTSNSGSLQDICNAITAAVSEYDCDILNLSFGFKSDFIALQEAIAYAVDCGALVVSAAGNGGTATVYYPAIYDNVMGVGGVNRSGGHYSGSNHHAGVFLTAPGEQVVSSDKDGGYSPGSGTSFATPLVSGAAAALWSWAPWLSAEELTLLLGATALDRGSVGWDEEFGWGILDLRKAMETLDAAPTGLFLSLSEGETPSAELRNHTRQRADCILAAAQYGIGGRQRSVSVTSLSLAPGETREVPLPEGPCRLFLCDGDWRPLCEPLETGLPAP